MTQYQRKVWLGLSGAFLLTIFLIFATGVITGVSFNLVSLGVGVIGATLTILALRSFVKSNF